MNKKYKILKTGAMLSIGYTIIVSLLYWLKPEAGHLILLTQGYVFGVVVTNTVKDKLKNKGNSTLLSICIFLSFFVAAAYTYLPLSDSLRGLQNQTLTGVWGLLSLFFIQILTHIRFKVADYWLAFLAGSFPMLFINISRTNLYPFFFAIGGWYFIMFGIIYIRDMISNSISNSSPSNNRPDKPL